MSDESTRPVSWKTARTKAGNTRFLPFLWFENRCEWLSFYLGRWAFLNVLEYLGKLSLVGVALLWLWEIPERKQATADQRKAKHYQAWQAINLAHGLVGNCGRYDALLDLHQDGVSLVGVNLAGAVINGIPLPSVDLYHADISDTLMSGADLRKANLAFAKAQRAELAGANLQNVDFTLADLTGASLVGADVAGVNFDGAILVQAELRDLKHWESISSINGADITAVREAPNGFVEWALSKGATVTTGKGSTTTTKNSDSGSKDGPATGKGQSARDKVKDKYTKEHPDLAFTNDTVASTSPPDTGPQANVKPNSAREKIRTQYLNRHVSRAFTNDLAGPHP